MCALCNLYSISAKMLFASGLVFFFFFSIIVSRGTSFLIRLEDRSALRLELHYTTYPSKRGIFLCCLEKLRRNSVAVSASGWISGEKPSKRSIVTRHESPRNAAVRGLLVRRVEETHQSPLAVVVRKRTVFHGTLLAS